MLYIAMRTFAPIAGLMFMGVFSLIVYASLADFATAGTLSNTSAQSFFGILPTVALVIGVVAVGAFVVTAFRAVFR